MAGSLTVGRQDLPQLPEIRQDLTLYPAERDPDGARVWHLHDPLSNRFYQMQEKDVEILYLMGLRDAKQVAGAAKRLLRRETDKQDLEDLVLFLRSNNLVRYDEEQHSYYEHALENLSQGHWLILILKNPIFFRIPLWEPDEFIERTLPHVRWMGSKTSMAILGLIALLGLYLASRQMDQFLGTFMHFFTLSGLAVYFFTLFCVKVLHELGHAYVAKAAGCRVPVIGVAFLVGWPVFYTDTSDAWKLANRNRRLAIGAAGVSVELAIASISLLLWSVAPEGTLKSALFLLATTTWLLSVVVNFNPLMRFDGYYLMSDYLRVPNLERRAFHMARWWMRERIFGLGSRPPEPWKAWFVVYAFAVWLYRFFLFLGIAVIVYQFFFKAAGLALFVAELILLIGRPVFRELKEWWKLRARLRWNSSTRRSLALVTGFLLLFFIPWRTSVEAPALLEGASADIYVPAAGQLSFAVPDDTEVKQGDLVFSLVSPKLDHEFSLVKQRYEELLWSQASLGFDAELRSEALIVGSALRTQNQRLRSLFEQRQQLDMVAPTDGVIVDVAADIKEGDWLPSGMRIGTVVNMDKSRLTAYLPEEDLSRIEPGMTARFYPENPGYPVLDARVLTVNFVGSGRLEKPYLASLFGGDLAVRDDDQLTMVSSHYLIEFQIGDNQDVIRQVVRGTVQIDGLPASIFSQAKRQFVSVFIRETGF